ncbi:hypothetical protein BDZ89DRAFT_1074545 [Hymenopellis radicata]|nr:hypothetical protein BDZ89DRAFT_1074545 [Hymenopellis radicata]
MDNLNPLHERDDDEALPLMSPTNLPHSFSPRTRDSDWAFYQSQPEFQANFNSNTVNYPHISQAGSSRMGRADLGFGALAIASPEYSDSHADVNLSPLHSDMFNGDFGQSMFDANPEYQTDTTSFQPTARSRLFSENFLSSDSGLLPAYNGGDSGSTSHEPDRTFDSWGHIYVSANAFQGTFDHHLNYLGNVEHDLPVLPNSSVYADWQEPMDELPITPTSLNSERSVLRSSLPEVSYHDSNTDAPSLPYAAENLPAAAGPSTPSTSLAGSIVEWSQHAPDQSTISYPWGTDGSSLASNSPRRIVLLTPSYYESPSPQAETSSPQSSDVARHSSPLRRFKGRVCDQCRRGHIGCPDRPRQPCATCRTRGIECTYND